MIISEGVVKHVGTHKDVKSISFTLQNAQNKVTLDGHDNLSGLASRSTRQQSLSGRKTQQQQREQDAL